MQYIGDAKAGALIGKDQYVQVFANCSMFTLSIADLETGILRTGIQKKKFPVSVAVAVISSLLIYCSAIGRHRWVDYAQVKSTVLCLSFGN